MDLDVHSLNPNLGSKESQESLQTTLMEEDSEGFDMGDLDLIGLEDSYKNKEFDKILPHQIESLEVVLSKAHQHKKLGIQLGSHWDSLKVLKESRKRGRKPDWQRTMQIGEMLVDSGRYPKLTRFFKPLENSSP